MRIPFVAGNWKMNLSVEEAVNFLETIKGQLPDPKVTETCIAASPLFLESMIKHNNGSPLVIAAENCFYEDEGAYTGETSPKALSEMGVTHVIIGHSERRKYFNETDDIINKKVHAAFRNHLTPIICCDETMSRRQSADRISWVVSQVTNALKSVTADQAKNIILAYEPSWAIGSGKTASTDEAEEGCYLIRQTVADLYSDEIANEIRVLYGGSVNDDNADDILAQIDIDGVLAGGASLKADSFLKLANFLQK
ncbi:triose-phosphate isomerase [Lentilactobacillus farraginis]|uniref:Triosephosphate isomerase n=1 Tax=Lentilactobacillus farraginis DSM 18382 = JCM 14108 TaxID=1423743 RepID=A0A0R1VQ28_9LACO|nr:triose-phosphate isomerase [Lentilactobacillus farraginis]KRM07847.1 triosephosphate isomerase [Lentilactobacillus farraginis DSM 18382 = JCM 14108]